MKNTFDHIENRQIIEDKKRQDSFSFSTISFCDEVELTTNQANRTPKHDYNNIISSTVENREDQATTETWSDDEEMRKTKKILIRKLDFHLLPLLSITYLLSYLDRSNIANAKLGGLVEETHLSSEQYQWSLSIFFFGYVLFEVPSNIILRRWRPSRWISLIMLAWGVIAVSLAAIKNFAGLLVCRFLLGIFEAGLFPGLIYFMSLWYPRKEQAIRLGFFWSFSALAGAFGGLLAFGIGQIKSSTLSQWQLIFLIEGIPTIIVAICCFFFLPDSPEHARFLNSKERDIEIRRMNDDGGASINHSFAWSQVWSVFTDWKTFIYSIIYITGTIPLQAVTLFLPSIIHGMGNWTTVQTQLMTIPPYIIAFIAIIIVSRSSDYFIERSFHLVLINLFSMCGLLLLMFIEQQHVNILYMSIVFLTAGTYANVSIKVAWFNNNFASLTRRAVASAVIVSIGSIGGVISGQIYQDKQKPRYFLGNTIAFSCVALQTILIIILRFIFIYINHRRQILNDDEKQQQIQRYGGIQLIGDRHPDFRYTL
ncbi:unnamed protein product [Rotaria sordida]|uniref:Major facilitator superfamily (MFS) profile domain-containing protein n=1 Tax=Rotaria sordida TaxID=392033 RepID=A0A815WGA4_9BILA|nr:unnamed protein product [Rotaria sordida]CAF1547411.1 unnamed protein product [Rotaria sordida]